MAKPTQHWSLCQWHSKQWWWNRHHIYPFASAILNSDGETDIHTYPSASAILNSDNETDIHTYYSASAILNSDNETDIHTYPSASAILNSDIHRWSVSVCICTKQMIFTSFCLQEEGGLLLIQTRLVDF